MKIICISIYSSDKINDPLHLLHSIKNLKSVGFFQRSNVSEGIDFISKLVIERIVPGIYEFISHNDYKICAYANGEGHSCIAIVDTTYPNKIACKLIKDVLGNVHIFTKYEIEKKLQELMYKYENISKLDHTDIINNEIDETKDILYRTIDSLMKRGESLDELVNRTTELSKSSKIFYKKASKMNSCCIIL
jgi:synaptobrevin family protein YKT6